MSPVARVLHWLFGTLAAPVSIWEDEWSPSAGDRRESLFIVSPADMARARGRRIGAGPLPSERAGFRSPDRSD